MELLNYVNLKLESRRTEYFNPVVNLCLVQWSINMDLFVFLND